MEVRPLNPAYLVAGGLFVVTAGIHAFAGGPEVNAPVQASELDAVVRSVSAVVWHALTAVFLIFGAAMFWAGWRDNRALVVTILAANLSFVALFLGIGMAMLGSILPMPQWIIFAGISAVMVWGLWRRA